MFLHLSATNDPPQGPFKKWTKAALEQYVHHGFLPVHERYSQGEIAALAADPTVPKPSGAVPDIRDMVTLKCDRAFESATYAGSNSFAWQRLPDMHVPTLVLAGQHTTTFQDAGVPLEHFRTVAARMPRGAFKVSHRCTQIGGDEGIAWARE